MSGWELQFPSLRRSLDSISQARAPAITPKRALQEKARHSLKQRREPLAGFLTRLQPIAGLLDSERSIPTVAPGYGLAANLP